MLVSQGARTFAALNGIATCGLMALVAPRCVSEWEYWKKRLNDSPSSIPKQDQSAETVMQDTVGAISCDSNGKLAAGVSRFVILLVRFFTHLVHSGGLLLKYPGRIGEVRNQYGNPERSINADRRLRYSVLGAGHTQIPKSASLAVHQV